MSKSSLLPRIIAAALAVCTVAVLTLGPRTLVAPARGEFMRFMDAATPSLLMWIPYGDAERVLNTLLFIPLGATVAMMLGRRLWIVAILSGFAVSALAEYAQRQIPGRVPDPEDVFCNTVGAAIGVGIVILTRTAARMLAPRGQRAADAAAGSVTRT